MSLVDAVLKSAAPSLLTVLGDAVTYRRPSDATFAPLDLLALDSPAVEAVGQSGFVELRHELRIERSAVAAPARGDTLTIIDSGAVLIVQHVEPDGPFWKLTVRTGGA